MNAMIIRKFGQQMKIGSLLNRETIPASALIGLVLTLTIVSWCLLGGVPLTAGSILFVLIFCLGVVGWASLCRVVWPSQCSLNTYLPLGYVLCSLAIFVSIMLKQGTILSCMIGSLSGAAVFTLKQGFDDRNQNHGGGEFSQKAITKQSIVILVIAAIISTFVSSDQLRSIANLRDLTFNTTINGWSDIILHANTVVSLSFLAPGQAPISTLDVAAPIIPYHYASYILSALISSSSAQASPLASYVAIVAPLGCMLLLLSLSEEAVMARSKHALISFMAVLSFLFLCYSLWIRLIETSFLDPAWLLITAPATLYACATIIAGLQIGATASDQNTITLVSLALLTFVLTVFSKIQIAHTLLPVVVMISSFAILRIRRNEQGLRGKDWLYLPLAIILFATAHLYGNWKLGIGRKQPFTDVMAFFTDMARKAWGNAHLGLDTVVNNEWLAPLLGLLTLCGPLLLIALILGMRTRSRNNIYHLALISAILSYNISLLLSPSMPWDDGEFLNRSWPLLWCLGAWTILGSGPIRLEHQSRQVLITGSLVAVVLGWLILPQPKRDSIASPAKREDWLISFYPTTIRSSEKKLAKKLGYSGMNTYFFASSSTKNSNFIFDDLPSRLAALSGMKPLLSRLSFQKSLPSQQSKNNIDRSVETRYRQMLKRYVRACPVSAGKDSPIEAFQSPTRKADQKVYVVCQDLERPGH